VTQYQYIGKGMALSADLKRTARRVREKRGERYVARHALLEPGQPSEKLQYERIELTPLARHQHCTERRR
jgi:hypothetical protein